VATAWGAKPNPEFLRAQKRVRKVVHPDYVSENTTSSSHPLVQWVTRADPYLLGEIDPRGPIGAVGVSIADAGRLDETLATARGLGLGVVVDTEPHRVQLEADHRLRGDAFKAADLDWLRGAFDPGTERLSLESRSDLIARHRDAQAGAGATIFRWTGHRVPEGYGMSAAREAEHEIAGEFLALCRASGSTHQAPGSVRPRHVAIGLAVEPRELASRTITTIAKEYADLDPDIFWIDILNFDGAAGQYKGARYLARLLQRESGRPVLLCGLGALAEAALRNQIAAVCIGWGRGEMCFPPRELPRPEPGKKRGAPLGIHDFHPAIRGGVPLDQRYERVARHLYRLHPCHCGYHSPTQRPEGQRERLLHNSSLAESLGALALKGEPTIRTAELGGIVRDARSLRAELGFGRLKTAWGVAATDPSDGARIDVPGAIWRRSAS
jgi:hypothetical protein